MLRVSRNQDRRLLVFVLISYPETVHIARRRVTPKGTASSWQTIMVRAQRAAKLQPAPAAGRAMFNSCIHAL